jgi:hypothetical protein
MPSVIAVVCGEGMPSLEEWNAAMQDPGLNVVIRRWINEGDGRGTLFVSVAGLLTVLEFEGAPTESHRTWFPVARVAVPGARGVLKFAWREGDKPAEAAAWAVASTVGAMRSGRLFTDDKVFGLAPSLGRVDARDLIAALPGDPSGPPDPPTDAELNDVVDQYFAQAGLELDEEATARGLLERTLEAHSALRDQGGKS